MTDSSLVNGISVVKMLVVEALFHHYELTTFSHLLVPQSLMEAGLQVLTVLMWGP